MSELLRQQKESFTLAAGAFRDFNGQFDFLHFETLPPGVTVELNGTPPLAQKQGAVRQGVPGQNQIERFRFVNTIVTSAAIVIFFGTGTFTISGEAVISGALPLPTGASTAALQTTGNSSLASVDGKLPALSGGKVPVTDPTALPLPTGAATGAKQDTGNASLATLAAAGTETARGATVTNTTTAFNGKKSVSVLNRATSTGNVTVTFSDASTVVLLPGEGQSWSVSDRLNTLTDISVTSPDATTTALVAHTA